MDIIWPETLTYLSTLPSAEYLCDVIAGKVVPPGITEIKREKPKRNRSAVIDTLATLPTKTMRIMTWNDGNAIIIVPIGPVTRDGLSVYCRFYAINTNTKRFVNIGPVNGCVLERILLFPAAQAHSSSYPARKTLSVHADETGQFVQDSMVYSEQHFRFGYPKLNYALSIRVPNPSDDARPKTFAAPRSFAMSVRSLEGDTDGPFRSVANWDKVCPGIKVDLSNPDSALPIQDMLFMMMNQL